MSSNIGIPRYKCTCDDKTQNGQCETPESCDYGDVLVKGVEEEAQQECAMFLEPGYWLVGETYRAGCMTHGNGYYSTVEGACAEEK